MASAIAAANEFIKLAKLEGQPIDQMKLQKLLFYGHAWRLAIENAPLFEGKIEAWPWGPVVREVYNETRLYGRKPIAQMLNEARYSQNGQQIEYTAPELTDPGAIAFVRRLWDSYKHYTGIQLSNATHENGEPWTIVKDQHGHLNHKPTIPNELIADVFKKKLTVHG